MVFTGEETLTSYIHPGSDVVSHRFCKVCGVLISKAGMEFDGAKSRGSTEDLHSYGLATTLAINANVLKDVNVKQLKIRQLD